MLCYTWNLTVNIGFNRNLFNRSYDISQGSLIYLNQNSSGKIALETLGNATYSDMKWGNNLVNYFETQITGNLANISGIKYVNYRFYLNALTGLEYYQNSFNFVHLYEDSFLFNLSVNPVGSSLYFNRPVLIDRKRFLVFFLKLN